MAISFNVPSEVQVATQSNWTATNTVYDLREPSNDPMEQKSWGTQDITGLFEKLGAVNYVSNNVGRHFEEDRLHQIITNCTGTTAGALAAVTYTLATGATGDVTITGFPAIAEPYIASGTTVTLIPVRVHETLVFPGNVRGKVTAVSGATFTAIPEGTTDLPTVIATDYITNLGVSIYEGFKGDITSNNWRENVVTWKSEIMRDAHETTGTAMAQKMWFETPFEGKTYWSWWYKGQKNAFKQFRNYREMKWIFGQSVTNSTTLATGYSSQYAQTSGLLAFASSFGNNWTYDLTTGITLDDFQNNIINTLDKNAGATENAMYEAISVNKAVNDFVRVEMQNGAIQYDALGGSKDAYVKFDFNSFECLGYSFHQKRYQPFNNPTMFGNPSSAYLNYAFGVPMSKDAYRIDGEKDKVDVSAMRINYLKLGDDNREWIENLTGGATNGSYTNDGDYRKVTMTSENAAEFFGSNRFWTLQGLNL